VIAAKTEFDNEVNYRKQKFDEINSRAASVMRVLEASGASVEKLDDARAYVQRIKGTAPHTHDQLVAASPQSSAAAPANADGNTAKKVRSQKQKSYASRTEAFAKLVSAVSTEPLYIANETALSVEGLKDTLDELNAANAQVSAAQAAWSKARIDRNAVLYNQDQSMYRTGLAVKKYVRGLFGPGSEQYTQLKSVVFSKPTKG
jgi:predicted lipid-binding transport protein (Tim44 family)